MEHDPHLPAADEELSGLFDDLRKFWNAYGTPLLWVVVIGSFSLLIYNFITTQKVTARENAWADLAGSTAPATFEQVAQDHSNPAVQQLARLTAADLYLREAADLEGDARTAKLDQAETIYQQAAQAATHDEFRINALEGLAVVAEGRRDLDQAKTRNDAVIALAKTIPGFESWSARAQARINLLPHLATPVTFTLTSDAPDVETAEESAEGTTPQELITPPAE